MSSDNSILSAKENLNFNIIDKIQADGSLIQAGNIEIKASSLQASKTRINAMKNNLTIKTKQDLNLFSSEQIAANNSIHLEGKEVNLDNTRIFNQKEENTANIYIKSNNLSAKNSQIFSSNDLSINSNKDIDLEDSNISGNKIDIKAKDNVILSKYNNIKNTLLKDDENYVYDANISAENSLSIVSNNITNVHGSLFANENINLIASGNIINTDSKISTNEDINITAKTSDRSTNISNSIFQSFKNIVIDVSNMIGIKTNIEADNIYINTSISNLTNATLSSNKNIDIISDNLSAKNLNIQTGSDFNLKSRGNIDLASLNLSANNVNIDAFRNLYFSRVGDKESKIISNTNLSLSGQNIVSDNLSLFAKNDLNLISTNEILLKNSEIIGMNLIDMHALKTLDLFNSQKIASLNEISLKAQDINIDKTNIFNINDNKNINISALTNISANSATIESTGDLNLSSKDKIEANSSIIKAGNINFFAKNSNTLENLDLMFTKIDAQKDISLDANKINTSNAILLSKENIYINKEKKLDSSQNLTSTNSFLQAFKNLIINALKINSDDSTFLGAENIEINSNKLKSQNSSFTSINGDINIKSDINNLSNESFIDLKNAKEIAANNSINIEGSDVSLDNTRIFNIKNKDNENKDNKNINIIANNISSKKSQIFSLNNLNIKSNKDIDLDDSNLSANKIDIKAEENLILSQKKNKNNTVSKDDENYIYDSTISSGGTLNISAKDIKNIHTSIFANKDLNLISQGNINTIDSKIYTNENLNIVSKTNISASNSIFQAFKNIVFDVFNITGDKTNILASNIDINASNLELTNSSLTANKNNLSIKTKEALNLSSSKQIAANNNIFLEGKEVNLNNTIIFNINDKKNINISALTNVSANSATIESTGDLNLSSKDKIEANSSIIKAGNINFFAKNSNTLENLDLMFTKIDAQKDISLDANKINTSNAILLSKENIYINKEKKLDSSQNLTSTNSFLQAFKNLIINALKINSDDSTFLGAENIEINSNKLKSQNSSFTSINGDINIKSDINNLSNESFIDLKNAKEIAANNSINIEGSDVSLDNTRIFNIKNKDNENKDNKNINIIANNISSKKSQIFSLNNLNIKSNKDIDLDDSNLSANKIDIKAEENLILSQKKNKNNTVSKDDENYIYDSTISSGGTLNISAKDIKNIHTSIFANKDLNLISQGNINTIDSKIYTNENLNIVSKTNISASNSIFQAFKNIVFDVFNITGDKTNILASNIDINASNLELTNSSLTANKNNLSIKTKEALNLSSSKQIAANNNIFLEGQEVNLNNTIIFNQENLSNIDIISNNLSAQNSRIDSVNELSLSANRDININNASLFSRNIQTVLADNILAKSLISSSLSSIHLNARNEDIILENASLISAKDINILSKNGILKFNGVNLTSGNNLVLDSKILKSNSQINNDKLVYAKNSLELISEDDITDIKNTNFSSSNSISIKANEKKVYLENNIFTAGNDITFISKIISFFKNKIATVNNDGKININTSDIVLDNDTLSSNNIHVYANEIIDIKNNTQVKGTNDSSIIKFITKIFKINNSSIYTPGELTLKSTGSLILDNNTDLLANKELNIETKEDLSLVSSTKLASKGLIDIKAKSITNNMRLLADGDLRITSTMGNLNNYNLISSQKDLILDISGNVYNQDLKSKISTDNLTLIAKYLFNDKYITASNNLTINIENDIVNKAAIAAQNNMILSSDNLYNYNTIYSSNNINLYVKNSLLNKTDTKMVEGLDHARIYAVNNILMAKNKDLKKINNITNTSSHIETLKGDIKIYSNTFINNSIEKPTIVVNDAITENYQPSMGHNIRVAIGNRTIITESLDLSNVRTSLLSSGKDINIYSDILNEYSTISAVRNINIRGSVSNIVEDVLYKKIHLYQYVESYRKHHRHHAWYRLYVTNKDLEPIPIDEGTTIIKAGGDITGTISSLKNITKYKNGLSSNIYTSVNTNKQKKQDKKYIRTITGLNNQNIDIKDKNINKIKETNKETILIKNNEDKDLEPILIDEGTTIIKAGGDITGTISSLKNITKYKNGLSSNIYTSVNTNKQKKQDKKHIRTITGLNNQNIDIKETNKETILIKNNEENEIENSLKDVISKSESNIEVLESKNTNVLKSGDKNEVKIFHNILTEDPLVNNFSLPTNPYGLFISNPSIKHKYLIEANPEYVNLKNFMSSDYFLKKMNIRADRMQKRLGDAMYETQLVRNSILALTGRRFIKTLSVKNDVEQYKLLMDNAINVSAILKLEIGKAPTFTQLSLLKKDIVWMESKLVNGEELLVPVVYLADDYVKVSGATIMAEGSINLTVDDLVNSGSIITEENLIVNAKTITNESGVLISNGITKLIALNNIVNKNAGMISGQQTSLTSTLGSIINETFVKIKKVGNNILNSTSTTVGANSLIESTSGNLILSAKKDIINKGGNLSSSSSIGLKTVDGDISIKALKKDNSFYFNNGRSFYKTKKIDYIQSSISANDSIIMDSGKNINLESVKMKAANTIGINASNDLNITAVNTLDYKDIQIYSKKSFGRSKTKRDMTYKETVVSSELSANNIVLNAGNNLNLEAAKLNAKGNIFAKAKDINIVAKTYREGELHYSKKKGFGGLSSSSSMDKSDALKLKESKLTLKKSDLKENITNYDLAVQINTDFKKVLGAKVDTRFLNSTKNGISIEADENITVIASEFDAQDKNVNFKAGDKLLLSSANEITSTENWTKKEKFSLVNLLVSIPTLGLLNTGPIYELDNKEEKIITSTSKASIIKANNIIIDAGSATIMGSDIETKNDIIVKTDIGSIEILAAENSVETTRSSKKIKVGMSNIADMVTSAIKEVSSQQTKLKVEIATATYDANKENINELTHTSSKLVSKNGNIILDSSDDMLIEGSNLLAKNGIVALISKDGDIKIKEVLDTLAKKRKETHAKAKLYVSVQNEYIEIKTAVKNLNLAKKAVKTAKRDQKRYKKDISNLENTLVSLKTDLINKVSGVDSNDIEELIEIIDDMKSDAYIYKAAIVASVVNVATKTTALIAQTAAAASSVTYGFSAGITLDLKGNKKQTNTSSTTSLASNLTANNLIINTSDNKDTTIQGSNVNVSNNALINTNNLNLLASEDTYIQDMKNKSVDGSITMGMGGLSVSLGLGKDKSNTNKLNHNNTQLNVDNNLDLNINNDLNIKGANVLVKGKTSANIKGDLNIISLRDINKTTSSSNSIGISAGESGLSGASGGISVSKSTNKTVLISSFVTNESDIKVKGNTHLEGSVLASGTIDSNGNLIDNNSLNLETKTITYKDLSNIKYEKSSSMNGSFSISHSNKKDKNGEIIKDKNGKTTKEGSLSNLSIAASMGLNIEKTKTLATLGSGNITLTGKNKQIDERLNRDVNNTKKELYKVDQTKGVKLVVDTRLLSEDGRKEIKKDVLDTKNHGQEIYQAVKDVSTNDDVSILEFASQVNKYATDRKVLVELAANKDSQKKLKGEEGAKGSQEEIQSLSNKLSKKDGLDENTNVSLYDGKETPDNNEVNSQNDFNKELSNAGYEDKSNSIIINVDKTDMTNSSEVIKSTLHEQDRHTQAKNNKSYSLNTETNLSKARGERGSSVWNDYSDLNGVSTRSNITQKKWNNTNKNSATILSGNEKVNKINSSDVKPNSSFMYALTKPEDHKKINKANLEVAKVVDDNVIGIQDSLKVVKSILDADLEGVIVAGTGLALSKVPGSKVIVKQVKKIIKKAESGNPKKSNAPNKKLNKRTDQKEFEEKKVPVTKEEAFDISYSKQKEKGSSNSKSKRDALIEVESFQGQIYKEQVKKGDEFVVNHTGGRGATGTYVIDKKDANKTPMQLQRELALPNTNKANTQTVIQVKEDHTILSGIAADKSHTDWATKNATGGGKQKVINPDKTNINDIFPKDK